MNAVSWFESEGYAIGYTIYEQLGRYSLDSLLELELDPRVALEERNPFDNIISWRTAS